MQDRHGGVWGAAGASGARSNGPGFWDELKIAAALQQLITLILHGGIKAQRAIELKDGRKGQPLPAVLKASLSSIFSE